MRNTFIIVRNQGYEVIKLTSHIKMEVTEEENKGFFQRSLLHVLVVAIGTFSIGLVLTFYSPAYETITDEMEFTELEGSFFNAIAAIAAIFGGPIINFTINKMGRKYPTLLTQVVIIIGWAMLIATKRSYKGLTYAARIVMGLGAGACSTVCPVYIAELSPLAQRGAYGVMSQFFLSFGACTGYLLGIWLNWRILAIICVVPAVLLTVLINFIPESPAVARINQTNQENTEKDHLFQAKFFKPLVIATLTVIFQQFSGINALLTNLSPIFNQSKISLKPAVASVIVSAAQVFTVACATPIVNFFGIRITWTISASGQALALLLSWANEKWEWSNSLPIVLLFADVLFFGVGLGPLPWFIVPELFPDSVRSFATSLIQGFNWFLCSLMMFVFQYMVNGMGLSWTYFFYGICMVASVLFAIFILPETKGKQMGKIDESQKYTEDDNMKNEILKA